MSKALNIKIDSVASELPSSAGPQTNLPANGSTFLNIL